MGYNGWGNDMGAPTGWGQIPPQSGGPSPYPMDEGGFGYLDFQRQEWKCPGCGTVNSFEVLTCPACGTSAMAILDKYKEQQKKGKLSQRRTGKPIGLKAGIKLLIGFGLLLSLVFVGYFLLVMSPLLIYAAVPFLILVGLFCLLHPKKKDRKKIAKDMMEQLQGGLIELVALIEEQAGL